MAWAAATTAIIEEMATQAVADPAVRVVAATQGAVMQGAVIMAKAGMI